MGNKAGHHKWKDKDSKSKKKLKKIKSREEYVLSKYPESFLCACCVSDEDRKSFARWIIDQQDICTEDHDVLAILKKQEDKEYKKQIKKIMDKPMDDLSHAIAGVYGLAIAKTKLKKKKKKRLKAKKYDMSIASFMNSKNYQKTYLNNEEYRKSLKKIAKREQSEMDEARKLGYVKSKDPDKELKKIYKANEYFSEALSDSYVQKYFL